MNLSKREKGVAELRDLFAKCATKKKKILSVLGCKLRSLSLVSKCCSVQVHDIDTTTVSQT